MRSTTWNLTEFSELDQPVVTAYAVAPRKHGRTASGIAAAVFAVVTAVAGAGTMLAASSQANACLFEMPTTTMAVAHSGEEQGPPLGAVFADRFDDNWSEAKETELLVGLAHRSAYSKPEREEQAVDSIHFGQQEEVSTSGSERLSRDKVRDIFKRRKVV